MVDEFVEDLWRKSGEEIRDFALRFESKAKEMEELIVAACNGEEALDNILNDEQAVGTATIEEQPKPLQVDDAVTRRDS